jgi:FixJ family two-component response regulator
MKNGHPLVAIVDDDESFRIALRRLIKSHGLNTATFDSGKMFLTHYRAGNPIAFCSILICLA